MLNVFLLLPLHAHSFCPSNIARGTNESIPIVYSTIIYGHRPDLDEALLRSV